jgi:hypothetical protein
MENFSVHEIGQKVKIEEAERCEGEEEQESAKMCKRFLWVAMPTMPTKT